MINLLVISVSPTDQEIFQDYWNVTKHHASNWKQCVPDLRVLFSAWSQTELEILSQTIQEPRGSTHIPPWSRWHPGTVFCMKVEELGAPQEEPEDNVSFHVPVLSEVTMTWI